MLFRLGNIYVRAYTYMEVNAPGSAHKNGHFLKSPIILFISFMKCLSDKAIPSNN